MSKIEKIRTAQYPYHREGKMILINSTLYFLEDILEKVEELIDVINKQNDK